MLCRRLNYATGCPEAIKSFWRTPKAAWMWFLAPCSAYPCLSRGWTQMSLLLFAAFSFATLPAYSDTSWLVTCQRTLGSKESNGMELGWKSVGLRRNDGQRQGKPILVCLYVLKTLFFRVKPVYLPRWDFLNQNDMKLWPMNFAFYLGRTY